jgi:hypothetical protein
MQGKAKVQLSLKATTFSKYQILMWLCIFMKLSGLIFFSTNIPSGVSYMTLYLCARSNKLRKGVSCIQKTYCILCEKIFTRI